TDSQLAVSESPPRVHKRIVLVLTLTVVCAALISTGWRAWKLKNEAAASLLQPVEFVDTAALLAQRLGGQYDKQTGKLVLARSAVTDSDLEALENQHQLREIDLDSTRITHAGLMHLKQLPQLQTLNLSGLQIDDNTFPNTQLPLSLISLDLSNTSIGD